MRSCIPLIALTCAIGVASPAFADETDNFTCRLRVLRDAGAPLDAIMNARIQAVLARANRLQACDDACLQRELQDELGGTYLHPLTGVPHSRFERWIGQRQDVERCHLGFRDSIYGARPYNQPWLFPFTGRVILLADSIQLAGRTVGIDKINHFVREGLAHWRAVQRPGGDIAVVLTRELGSPRRQLRWNEYGLKGWSLTGVVAYADLAASYSGFRFWDDVLSSNRAGSFVVRDPSTMKFRQQRTFSFADYVNDAWDEGINCSIFQPALARQVASALARRALSCPAADATPLSNLPDANLYVNPKILAR